LAFSYLVLQHTPSKELVCGAVNEMIWILRPGGVSLFQFNGSHQPTMRSKLWMRNHIPTLMSIVQETKKKAAARSDSVRLLITQLWLTVVLIGFLVIRILDSNSAHRLFSWFKGH
jgi:hypothetical protein